jgi:hypothetical protein
MPLETTSAWCALRDGEIAISIASGSPLGPVCAMAHDESAQPRRWAASRNRSRDCA